MIAVNQFFFLQVRVLRVLTFVKKATMHNVAVDHPYSLQVAKLRISVRLSVNESQERKVLQIIINVCKQKPCRAKVKVAAPLIALGIHA